MKLMLEKLSLVGIVPVIKVEDAADAVPLCKALSDGGLPVAEITFRSEAAEKAIERVHAELPDVMLGAGTVLTTEQVDRAVAAGAAYIVSPGLNPKVVSHCIDATVPIIPGCSSPSDIEIALEMGITTVKFFPAEALGGLKTIKAMSAPYGSVTFLPTGGVNEGNLLDYLAFPKVLACGGSWMVDQKAITAKDWGRIETLARSAVNLMLGLELKHVGINSGNPERAMRDAQSFCGLLGWEINDSNNSTFVGTGFEMMKKPFRGTHGHIAVGCNSIARAKWHLERRGFGFDETSASFKDGALKAVYLRDEIAGFAIHLIQK
jgi:2-dehydro-3-deoxyphosphogluconate aldolase/(4S)-4-hydroxy-2-oxoglutarate aldolase